MVATNSLTIEQLPYEMITAIAADAAGDADRVCLFLDELGLGATREKPRSLPAEFLLHLGAALRLLDWEAQGFFFHRDMGLPDAYQAIRDAFLSAKDPAADTNSFCIAVLRLSVERLAWTSRPDLGADVALEEPQEDVLLDALADFLWAKRPR